MNHRSNMDYVLVTWLVSDRMTLSYAVGEWARIWPLRMLVRAMGAYFIRRRYQTPLYRRVLERYVQMATAEGVTQAVFPEGGLSLDGRVGEPRLGLLGHIVSGMQAAGGRDVVFIPVGLSYDRVLEDRLLIEADQTRSRRFPARPGAILRTAGRLGWQMLRRRFPGFGAAGVAFGAPVSLHGFLAGRDGAGPAELADHLMRAVRDAVPVLPVPLVAAALLSSGSPVPPAALVARAMALGQRLEMAGAVLLMPGGDRARGVAEGLAALRARGLLSDTAGRIAPAADAGPLLSFYAAPVRQRLEPPAPLPPP